MAIGEKKPVVMQSDRAVPSGIATLGADGKLLDAQIPSLAKLGAAPAPLMANKTLYVATTGSDTTGDGTEANPYKTIQKAVNTLPKDLGTYMATIHVAAGTYPDGVRILGFLGGYQNSPGVKIEGESRDTVLIQGGIEVSACSAYIHLDHLHIVGNNSNANVVLLENRHVCVSHCKLDGAEAPRGVWGDHTNLITVYGTVVSDKTQAALYLTGGTIEATSISGDNNAVGLQVGSGSSAAGGLGLCHALTINADTLFRKENCGVIFSSSILV